MKKGILAIVTVASLVGLAGCKSDAGKASVKTPSIAELAMEAGEVMFGLQTSYEKVEYTYDDEDESKIVGADIMWEYQDGESDNYIDAFYGLYGTSKKAGAYAALIEKYNMTCLIRPSNYTFGGQYPGLGATYGIKLKGTEYLSMGFFTVDFSAMEAGLIAGKVEVALVDIAASQQEQ